MKYDHIVVPADGERVALNPDFSLNVPDRPILPFVEGDGIGIDVTPVMRKVVDAAVVKAYGASRRIAWMEIYAGEKSNKIYGAGAWFPDETLQALRDFVVSIKGPLGTPVGGGIRSLNVAIRQQLDLYACERPIRHFPGVSLGGAPRNSAVILASAAPASAPLIAKASGGVSVMRGFLVRRSPRLARPRFWRQLRDSVARLPLKRHSRARSVYSKAPKALSLPA